MSMFHVEMATGNWGKVSELILEFTHRSVRR